MGFKKWFLTKIISNDYYKELSDENFKDASSRDLKASSVKRLGLRQGDITSKEFEEIEFDFSQIVSGYNTDSYIRQGCDKYVDQIFKEGYDLFSKNEQALEYIKLRLKFIAESTKVPTDLLLMDIAEDVVKFSNCFIVKARNDDSSVLPPGLTIQGIMEQKPIVGYFCINATTIKIKRDKNGTVQGYQQEVEGGDKPLKFKADDVVHFFYKKEKGNSVGTPFLWTVLDDVRALRQAEENVLRCMYRNIHPFIHVQVGTDDAPGDDEEVQEVKDKMEDMDVEGGIATSNRVNIKAIASDKAMDAEPYLRYLEERVFSGMGIPGILFGRGGTANRSTGDNMTSEMADRIKAIQRCIESFFNEFIVKELLLEGGFDPILNPDDLVEFKFKENQQDSMIKLENHIAFKFEHNLITEDEARAMMNMDPIQDRNLLNRELTLKTTLQTQQVKAQAGGSGASKEVTNKNKPKNQYGTKTSPKKTSDILRKYSDIFDYLEEEQENENS